MNGRQNAQNKPGRQDRTVFEYDPAPYFIAR